MAKSAMKPKRSVRHGQRRPGRAILAVAAVGAVGGAALYLSFRADDSAPTADAVLRTQRYCELATQLEGALSSSGLPADRPLPADASAGAINQVFTRLGPRIEELELVAPPSIRKDTKLVVSALRRAGEGDMATTRASGFTDAQRRIGTYRQQLANDPKSGCQQGSGAGDG